jgi:4-amino-4-deoxy-L-arabinose transferase-like glycosyltransferase
VSGDVTRLDLDASGDRRVRRDRDGRRNREAGLIGVLASSPISSARVPQRSKRVSRTEVGVLLALSALALALRLPGLSRGIYTDEAYSLALAQRSFGQMLALFGYEPNGMPYSIVLWPLIRIFGSGLTLLRLPAVIAGSASVPALWWAARRYAAPAAALLAAALLAVNPMAVFYSQDARAYAFVVLSACLAFGALAAALEHGSSRRRAWAVYIAAMVALAYSEIFAAPLVLPAQALVVWRASGGAGAHDDARARRDRLVRWLWSLLAVLVCCLPLLFAAAVAASRRNALYWLPKTSRGLVSRALQEFTAGLSGQTAARWATLAAGALLVGAALWVLWRRRRMRAEGALATALCWGLLPGAVLLAVSFAHPVFWPRYVIVSLPGLCLVLALAAERLWRSRAGALTATACVAVVTIAAAVADVHQRSAVEEGWPAIALWLRHERAPGQPVIVDDASVLPSLGYYDPALRAPNGDLAVQEWHDRPLPAGFVGFKDPGGWGNVPDGPPSLAAFKRLARRGGGGVWMVVAEVDSARQSDPTDGAAVAWARRNCDVQVRTGVNVWALHASDCRLSGAA